VGLMRYHASMAVLSSAGQAMAAAAALVHDAASAEQYGFPALAAMSWAYTSMLTALLAFAETPGELGMLVAHEGANWPSNFLPLAAPLLPFMSACAPVSDPSSHCFPDELGPGRTRVLPYQVTLSSGANSREWCASQCSAHGYAWAGVEFGVACFCGPQLPQLQELPASACSAMPCAAAAGEACGGSDIISVFPAQCAQAPGLPPGLLPPAGYQGAPRAFQTAVRSTVSAAEGSLQLELAVLAQAAPETVQVTWWWVFGQPVVARAAASANSSALLQLSAPGRGLYQASIPLAPGAAQSSALLEYVLLVSWGQSGTAVAVPVEGARTVLVLGQPEH
jgi:hypothetical protein